MIADQPEFNLIQVVRYPGRAERIRHVVAEAEYLYRTTYHSVWYGVKYP